ncbi:cupin domain-containing protein [uncultured Dialister sp.]|uniref:cupin domain-containing protein n=1 Tax=uncultured Dialister sp. TaxID=278064 RepID=UPI0025FFEBDF|nr:cupin domain-containing protein [uncultured Dialister sp.]
MLPKLEPIIKEHANGGKGHLIIEPILSPKEMGDKCRLYAHVIIPKGCSMGVHQHKGDGECYYILSGRGLYTDDDKTYEMGPGDAAFCESGHFHGIENIGDEDLVIMGLIIYK